MPRLPIPTWVFVLVIVRDGRRFLLVEERPDLGGWYLPAGRVEPGEELHEAAIREAKEEGGIEVTLDGVYRFEYTPLLDGYSRCRVVFAARPTGEQEPKSVADSHSLSAAWFTLEQAKDLEMRSPDAWPLLLHASLQPPSPLEILGSETRWDKE